jgi:hypothetical protein
MFIPLIAQGKQLLSSLIDLSIVKFKAIGKEVLLILVCSLGALVSWYIFNARSQFISSIGNWFSSDVNYQFQVFSFWRGKLSLLDSPQGMQRDWVWHNGAQQVWGLGIPLLLYVGSFFATIFPVPDRLIFSLVWVIIGTFIIRSYYQQQPLTGILLILIPSLVSPLVGVAHTRLWVYELAVLWSTLITLGAVAVTTETIRGGYRNLWSISAGLSGGFLLLVRPTHGAYTVALSSLFFILATKEKKYKAIIFYASGIVIGIAALLVTNQVRFGNQFEFGHRINLFGDELTTYLTKWPTFKVEQLKENIIDLYHGLMAYRSEQDGDHNPLRSTAMSPRVREFYFRIFTPLELLSTLVFLCITYYSKNLVASFLGRASALSFILLTAFYLVYPVMSSRYLIDFAPAVILSFWSLAHHASSCKKRFWWYVLLVLPLMSSILTFKSEPQAHAVWKTAVNPTTHVMIVPEINKGAFALPTDAMKCPYEGKLYAHPFYEHEIGWDLRGTCVVGVASNLLMKSGRCITLRGQFTTPDAIEVNAGLSHMYNVSRTNEVAVFCTEVPLQEYTSYFVKFTSQPLDSSRQDRLHSIETSNYEIKNVPTL